MPNPVFVRVDLLKSTELKITEALCEPPPDINKVGPTCTWGLDIEFSV